jgi:hypothetical protein
MMWGTADSSSTVAGCTWPPSVVRNVRADDTATACTWIGNTILVELDGPSPDLRAAWRETLRRLSRREHPLPVYAAPVLLPQVAGSRPAPLARRSTDRSRIVRRWQAERRAS